MNNAEYWIKRAERRLAVGDKEGDELLETMRKVYENSVSNINKEIEAFFGRYATNNNLTLTEVHKLLNSSELKSAKEEMKRYYENINEYARTNSGKGKVMIGRLRAYSDVLREQSARAYISRLEELKISLENVVLNLGIKEEDAFQKAFKKVYFDVYSNARFDVDMQKGFTTGFQGFDEGKLNKAIREKWLGENYSDRIWKNKDRLVEQLNTTFLQGIAQGHNPKKIARLIQNNYSTAYHNCERLARTEFSHIAGDATYQSYVDCGVSEYQFVATLDSRTSDVCQSLDGKVFKVKEKEVGVNYPPMHPYCRSFTVAYFEFDDIDALFDKEMRAARDEDGKIYYVPSDVTYSEWRNKYLPTFQKMVENDFKTSETRKELETNGVERVDIGLLKRELTEDEIIRKLSGGDLTNGSCASLALAYCANRAGMDVTDYRGGESTDIFSRGKNLIEISNFKGVKTEVIIGYDDFTNAKTLLKKMKKNKEYILFTGQHASIVRRGGNKWSDYEFLEMQQPNYKKINGWISMSSVDMVLYRRFGCRHEYLSSFSGKKMKKRSTLIEVESLGKNLEFYKLMPYLNTTPRNQMKGDGGKAK